MTEKVITNYVDNKIIALDGFENLKENIPKFIEGKMNQSLEKIKSTNYNDKIKKTQSLIYNKFKQRLDLYFKIKDKNIIKDMSIYRMVQVFKFIDKLKN